MLVLMRGLARRYKNLVNKISKAEMNASFIEYEMFQLLRMFEELSEQAPDCLGAESPVGGRSTAKKPLLHLAESGASSLEINARTDGMADVRVDGGNQFTLPPMLADLMTALSMDNGRSEDAFVGWKTVSEITDYLTRQQGKPVSRRAITQNVYRLRRELFDRGGVNPYLVQSNRLRGMRLALRCKPNSVVTENRCPSGEFDRASSS